MSRNIIETVMGAVVLAVAAVFFAFAYGTANLRPVEGYEVLARFQRIDGLAIGADVRISGVRVGTITAQTLDPATFQAVVHLSIDRRYRLPEDTSAEIVSESLLGGKYVSLSPGGAEEMLPEGGTITLTQSSINVEQLIGRYIFSPPAGGSGSGGEGEGAAGAGAPGTPGDSSGLAPALPAAGAAAAAPMPDGPAGAVARP